MPISVPDSVILAYLRLGGRNRVWTDAVAMERHVAESALRPSAYGPPRRLRRDVAVRVQRVGTWPLYTLTPAHGAPTGTVIYAHGGGWVNEIVSQHWALCAQIAAEANTTVLVPIYPLIPEGTAAQVVPAVAEMAANAAAAGPMVLAGDSAGGQIALSAALALRDRDGRAADRTILISPGLDATLSHPQLAAAEALDPWLGQPGIRVVTEYWRGSLAKDDPMVSPLFGAFQRLGPMTIFTGTHDTLNPDARLLATRATEAGVAVDLQERKGLVHVYPLLPTAEGATARRLIVDQVRAAVTAR